MAHRPDLSKFDKPLTREEVKQLQSRFAGKEAFQVQRAYQQAYEKCRIHGDLLPKAADIQEMVVTWKILRQKKQRRPISRE